MKTNALVTLCALSASSLFRFRKKWRNILRWKLGHQFRKGKQTFSLYFCFHNVECHWFFSGCAASVWLICPSLLLQENSPILWECFILVASM